MMLKEDWALRLDILVVRLIGYYVVSRGREMLMVGWHFQFGIGSVRVLVRLEFSFLTFGFWRLSFSLRGLNKDRSSAHDYPNFGRAVTSICGRSN
jgi:hypothetical protein